MDEEKNNSAEKAIYDTKLRKTDGVSCPPTADEECRAESGTHCPTGCYKKLRNGRKSVGDKKSVVDKKSMGDKKSVVDKKPVGDRKSVADRKSVRDRKRSEFRDGVRDGIPICLGYIPVSFAFGLYAKKCGLALWQALLVSMTNVTSAGQLSGVTLMAAGGILAEIGLSQFFINLRYSLMSMTLTQRLDRSFGTADRLLLSFMITDEIFGVASIQKSLTKQRLAGISLLPYLGWCFGTFAGAFLGEVLPARLVSALGIAIYGMFIAIVVPRTKDELPMLFAVLLCCGLSCLIYFTPLRRVITQGYSIILCSALVSVLFALLCPVKEVEENA